MPAHDDLVQPQSTLTDAERETYQWQTSIPGFGEEGQRRLRGASVLISRIGGVGGAVAYSLAAAGIGRLLLAHHGNVGADDLNRQLLMTHDWIGRSRIESASRRLRELNPLLVIESVDENMTPANAGRLVEKVDLVVSCAPLFEERLEMNRAAVGHGKPMVDCAVYQTDASITTILPGRSACLACICPAPPVAWKRRFPVIGAVAHMIGAWGAMEAIKIISGLGEPLAGRMLLFDMAQGHNQSLAVQRDPKCLICSGVQPGSLPVSSSEKKS